MRFLDIFPLGYRHLREAVAGELMVRTGIDRTRPVFFSAIVAERCNSRCQYCDDWRQDEYDPEIDIEQWKAALTSVKDFVGPFMINFSGGEPLIKRGVLDLFDWCGDNNIRWGVVTNGSRLTPDIVKRLVAARPFNVNISIDGLAPVHDELRGVQGLFTRCENGIRLLRDESQRAGTHFPIIIKPTVTAMNYADLPDLVAWVKDAGASAVNFQPLQRSTPETYGDLWIEESDLEPLRQVIERLVEMKNGGHPILNSDRVLRAFPDYFAGQKITSREKAKGLDRSVLQHFKIWVDGSVYLSDPSTSIGDLTEERARDVWNGKLARQRRHQLLHEGPGLRSLNARFSDKTLRDKMQVALKLLGSSSIRSRTSSS